MEMIQEWMRQAVDPKQHDRAVAESGRRIGMAANGRTAEPTDPAEREAEHLARRYAREQRIRQTLATEGRQSVRRIDGQWRVLNYEVVDGRWEAVVVGTTESVEGESDEM